MQRLVRARRRWAAAGLGPGGRRRALRALASAWTGGPGPWRTAHDLAQNDPLLHVFAHAMAVVRPALWPAPPRERLGALLGAPVASLLRRAAGLAPTAPGGGSLRATWARRQG